MRRLGLLMLGLVLVASACDGEYATDPSSVATTTSLAPTTDQSNQRSTVVRTGVTTRRAVALTFDTDGDPGGTVAILGTLRMAGIRATFAVTGRWAEENESLLQAIAADGHQLVNHTYNHASFTGASSDTAPLTFQQRSLELSRTETTVFRLTNRSTRPWFSPPHGDIDASVERDGATLGYPFIAMWSIDTSDWPGAEAEEIVERTVAGASPGAIVLMHADGDSQDAAALPDIIESLRGDGYRFETIEEIIAP